RLIMLTPVQASIPSSGRPAAARRYKPQYGQFRGRVPAGKKCPQKNPYVQIVCSSQYPVKGADYPREKQLRNTAICPRVVDASGQYVDGPQPVVMPSSAIFWMNFEKLVAGGNIGKPRRHADRKCVARTGRSAMMKTGICPGRQRSAGEAADA